MLRETCERFDSDGPNKPARVYSYCVDGVEFRLKTVDHSLQAHAVGDECIIWYNPAKPKEAQAFHGSDACLKKLLLAGLALVLLGIVLTFVGFARQFG